MDRCSGSTPHEVRIDGSSAVKENQAPVNVHLVAPSVLSAPKACSTEQRAHLSSPTDSTLRKYRRVLHTIDNTCPRRDVYVPKCPVPLTFASNHSDLRKHAKNKTHGQATTSSEAKKAKQGLVQDDIRPSTVGADEATIWTDATSHFEHQKSENLAWMDMLLALLEKRYDATSTLPVCLTDLEAANAFQLPQRKKFKTEITSAQAALQATSTLDVSRIPTSASTNNRQMTATSSEQTPLRFGHDQEQTKEEKRQRLLLRYAQQIQAATVSSSTSCGCKTGCLKMYCTCFSSRGFCHTKCACDDCKNGRTNQTERVEAIQNYLANDPRAFSFASRPQDANATDFLHLLPQKSSSVVMRGCRCKKSKCSKKYCECFQNGIVCTSHCRCMDCSNHSDTSHLQQSLAHDEHTQYGSTRTRTLGPEPFHSVQVIVTKQPRRNYVSKTLRLNL